MFPGAGGGLGLPSELRLKYDRLSDALYIRVKEGSIVESDEIAPGIIVDYNEGE